MAAIRATTATIAREIFLPSLFHGSVRIFRVSLPVSGGPTGLRYRRISYGRVLRAALDSGGDSGKKAAPSRLAHVQQLMMEAKERAASAGNDPIPKITLELRLETVGKSAHSIPLKLNPSAPIVIPSQQKLLAEGHVPMYACAVGNSFPAPTELKHANSVTHSSHCSHVAMHTRK